MGAALYIALENKIPDLDTIIDGKISADEAADLLGDDVAGIEISAAEWFSAEEGLKTIDALLAEVDASPELRAAKDDLLGCQRVLREAQKRGVRWHLAIDF